MTKPETTNNTLGQLLAHVRLELRQAEIDGAELDARLLVQHFTGATLTDFVIRSDTEVAPDVTEQVLGAMQRRLAGEPVHRIIGEREFYGLSFKLNADTLEPRPDTEALIGLVLPFLEQRSSEKGFVDLLDMGTGTGAIAVTLLHEIKTARGVAVDIAEGALQAARINAKLAGVSSRLAVLKSDWFGAVRGEYDLIVSNPPYIPAKTVLELDREVKDYDPRRALDGGEDGLNFYRALAKHSGAYLHDNGIVAVEIGAGQADDTEAIFAQYSFRLTSVAEDLAGHKRALSFQR
ncbi:peptide chain release factor N(5)-glutamine methyltransferase [Pseudochrobactrum lubricantis]|uniref:peptide chain release factor N(5)-glutamine methyltransferase n=1 Tax=Pseudochrobactrum lubricantis TaxID=558172 RepID=UPI0035DE6E5A